MGDMVDYYLSQEDPFDPLDTYWNSPEPESQHPPISSHAPSKTVWVTRDGRRIRVRKMSDSHLVNTIRYLRRTAEFQLIESTLAVGHYLDGDPPDGAWMAATAAGHDLQEMDADDWLYESCLTFEALLGEAERRGLQL